MKFEKLENVKNSTINNLVDEYIHNDEHRRILKSRLIDGLTYPELAYMYNHSERNIKKIVYREGDRLLHIMQQLNLI